MACSAPPVLEPLTFPHQTHGAAPPVLEPLTFPHQTHGGVVETVRPSEEQIKISKQTIIKCLFCDVYFNITFENNAMLKHLVESHKLVISDVKSIADFEKYITYWRQRFSEKSVSEFCSLIQTNSKQSDIDPQDYYHLLCDVLPEDKQVRADLQKQKLEEVLQQQQEEREDTNFSRCCLFCREHFAGNRSDVFNHMSLEHNLGVGHVDNIVYATEMLDILEEKMKSLKCLYCEKTFKDRFVLKEHMRKKQHKKINPKNTAYDKFYIINYLEPGKNWRTIQAEKESDPGNESDVSSLIDEWEDWTDEDSAEIVCLFCDQTFVKPTGVVTHMKNQHKFDIQGLDTSHNLTFYQQVKVVNYIRRKVYQLTCPVCQQTFTDKAALQEHLQQREDHLSSLPHHSLWDQPEYFFPTYEDDGLLCILESEDRDPSTGVTMATIPSTIQSEDRDPSTGVTMATTPSTIQSEDTDPSIGVTMATIPSTIQSEDTNASIGVTMATTVSEDRDTSTGVTMATTPSTTQSEDRDTSTGVTMATTQSEDRDTSTCVTMATTQSEDRDTSTGVTMATTQSEDRDTSTGVTMATTQSEDRDPSTGVTMVTTPSTTQSEDRDPSTGVTMATTQSEDRDPSAGVTMTTTPSTTQSEDPTTGVVIAEDCPVSESILSEQSLRQQLM